MYLSRHRWLTIPIATPFFLLLIDNGIIGAKEDERNDWDIPGSPYEGFISDARDENGERFRRLRGVFDGRELIRSFPLVMRGEYNLVYPKLRKGDIIPVWNLLYRVEGQPRPGGDFLSLIQTKKPIKEIPEMTIFAELPEEVIPKPTSYTVPLKGYSVLRRFGFEVLAINSKANSKKATAQIQLFHGKAEYNLKMAQVTIENGGEFRLGPRSYHVRNIVAPDPKQHFIGWIELDPEPKLPKEPFPPRSAQPTVLQFPDRITLGHLANYDLWISAGRSWFLHTPWIGKAKAEDPRDFTVNLPRTVDNQTQLTPGMRFPVLGHVYQVSPFHPGSQRMHEAGLVDPADLPKGVRCSPNAFAVAMGGYGRIYERWFGVVAMTAEKNKPPTATIEIYGENAYGRDGNNDQNLPRHVVKIGDLIPIGKKTYRVLNIVPPDAKNKIIGWVEFDPVPVKTE